MDPSAPLAPNPPRPAAHTWFDDTHALIAGSLFVALGMIMFGHAGLLTGGVAGVAFLASYASGLLALLRHQASVGGVNILALNHRPGRYLGV